MKLPLRYFGHPDLRARAQEVEEITPDVVEFVADLIEAMVHYGGVGLAATQVGRRLRIFAFRSETLMPDGNYHLGEPEIAINPILSNPSKEAETAREGCLSLPGLYPPVKRPKNITVEYLNLKGEKIVEHAEGHRARVYMHENDHLNGVLSIDRIEARERQKLQPLLAQIKKKYNG
jgi:peptide deformylase